MTDIPLWKVVIDRTIDLDEVIAAADMVPAATPVDAPVRGVQLQRVDTTERATVIFVSTSDEGAKAFARILGGREDGTARVDRAEPKELMAEEAIEG